MVRTVQTGALDGPTIAAALDPYNPRKWMICAKRWWMHEEYAVEWRIRATGAVRQQHQEQGTCLFVLYDSYSTCCRALHFSILSTYITGQGWNKDTDEQRPRPVLEDSNTAMRPAKWP
jgi:hypothetical protein